MGRKQSHHAHPKEVKVIAAVPEPLRANVYARLKLANLTFKDWLWGQMQAYAGVTPLRDRGDAERRVQPQAPNTLPPPLQGQPPFSGGSMRHLVRLHEVLGGVIDPQDAVTIAQLVQVSASVRDAVVVYATPGAAQLFGYELPRLLVGQYTSTISHPTDALVARHYTLARWHREWCPNPHPIRILRHPSLEPVPVFQQVFQALIGDVLTWITVYTPFDYAAAFCMPVTSAMLTRAGSPSEEQLLGRMHVAHMEQMVRARHPTMPPSLSSVVHTTGDYVLCEAEKDLFTVPNHPNNGLAHRIARAMHSLSAAQDARPHYVCLKCRWPWYGAPGRTTRPNKCPRCNDKYWDRPPRHPHAE
jgi:hypothetical protein